MVDGLLRIQQIGAEMSQEDRAFEYAFRAAFGGRRQTSLAERWRISQSVVSDYFNGRSVPKLYRLVQMCRVFDVHPAELASAAGYDPRWAAELYDYHFIAGPDLLDGVYAEIDRLVHRRNLGESQAPIEAFRTLESVVRRTAEEAFSDRVKRSLMRRRALLLYNIAASLRETTRDRQLVDETSAMLKVMDDLTRELGNDQEMAALAHLTRGHMYSTLGAKDAALREFCAAEGLRLHSSLPVRDVELTRVRVQAMALASHRDDSEVRSLIRQMRDAIDRDRIDTPLIRPSVFESIGLCRAILGDKGALDDFAAADAQCLEFRRAGSAIPLSEIEIGMLRIRALRHLGEDSEREILAYSHSALRAAEAGGYDRYADIIRDMAARSAAA